jgi:hypothetical protein
MRIANDIGAQSGIAYTQRSGIAPEAELSILANIYALALQKYSDKHEATHPGSPDDKKNTEEVGNVGRRSR